MLYFICLYIVIFERLNSKFRFFVLGAIVCISILGYHYLADNESVEYYSGRSEEITMNTVDNEVHSGFYRIYRGFFVYHEYNFYRKNFWH